MRNVWQFGLVEIAQAIADGSITSECATAVALDRLEHIGARLNATVRIERETALEAARAADHARGRGERRGLLAGVPLAHKDLFYRTGRPALCGSIILRGFVPDVTATVLQRLDAAGAIDCGTLHLAEFAVSPTGFNQHYGHGRNPWNAEYCSGGSSSGSGAAVAARIVPAALGTDTGGSIRHPAAMCGITGIKPTNGLVSNHGAMPLVPSFDCVGPLALSARDAARMLTVIAGPDLKDGATAMAPTRNYEHALTGDITGLTVAVPHGYYRDTVAPEVAALLDASLDALADAGARIVKTDPPDMNTVNALTLLVLSVEAATLHRKWLTERPQDYADQVRARIEPGLFYPATRYAEALMMRGTIAREWIAAAMGNADLVHIPTLPVPVPSIEESTRGAPAEVAATIGRLTHCTRAINYLGLPSIAVPCGFTANGLPSSFQLVGRPYAEPILLRSADAYQRRTDWHKRLPPLAAEAPQPAPAV
jgi:aspartyl-tRNA(Asn)/glutamyl-tRNA(Gln) amidotransferase subunit A